MELYTKELYEGLKQENLIVLVFGAEWCGPCHMLHRLLEKVIPQYEGKKIKFLYVSIDEEVNKEISTAFSIRNIPTMIYIAGGEAKEKLIGYQSEKDVRKLIEKYLPV